MKAWIFVSILITAVLFQTGCDSGNQPAPGLSSTPAQHAAPEIELAVIMGRMQLYMNKLYFAGIGNNKELRDFYIHEIEEAMEDLVDGKVMHDGVDISQNMEMFGVAQLDVFEKAIEANPDQFKEAYNAFVNACNSCHIASKYPFIIIKEPTTPVFDNQVYEAK
jgi:hypothetical protein